MNGWIQAKAGPTTMGFLTRDDLPFHYALADAYTVGDDYHCSVISATGPNRIYLMSGTINADQSHPGYGGTAPHVAYDGGGNLQRNFLTWQAYVRDAAERGRVLADLPLRRRLRRQRPALLRDLRQAGPDPDRSGDRQARCA